MVVGVQMQSLRSMKAEMTLTNIFALNQIVVRSGSQLMQMIQTLTPMVVNLNSIQFSILHLHIAMSKIIILRMMEMNGILCQKTAFWMASPADG